METFTFTVPTHMRFPSATEIAEARADHMKRQYQVLLNQYETALKAYNDAASFEPSKRLDIDSRGVLYDAARFLREQCFLYVDTHSIGGGYHFPYPATLGRFV